MYVQVVRLSTIILRVSDLDVAVAFWRDLVGLELQFSGGEFAFLEAGGVQLALNHPEILRPQQSQTEIVFEVDDINEAFSELRGRGVPFEVEPRAVTESEGRVLMAAHFSDPDGHYASITGWVDQGEVDVPS